MSIPTETPRTMGVLTPACGSAGGEALGKLAKGDGLATPATAQLQSLSATQLELTQRLSLVLGIV